MFKRILLICFSPVIFVYNLWSRWGGKPQIEREYTRPNDVRASRIRNLGGDAGHHVHKYMDESGQDYI